MSGVLKHAAWAREYCTKVEGELQMICNTILGLLDQMKADYYRYIAEFTSGDAKSKAAYCAEAAYAEAAAVAEKDLAVTHPIRMGLALNYLNYLVFLYVVQSKPDDACKMARTAFEDAIAELDNVGSDYAQDFGPIGEVKMNH